MFEKNGVRLLIEQAPLKQQMSKELQAAYLFTIKKN